MSELKVNKISPRSGTDVTLGDSGDTITIPAGATFDASSGTLTLADGSVTNAKLAGSITNDKLTNSSITINGSSVSLGGSTTIETGTSWQSDIKTAAFTAVAGEGYWINTTSAAITVTLPSSASVGDQIIFTDYARTWGTNAVTLNRNGLNYQGGTQNAIYDTNGQSVNIVYSGAIQGWIPISDDDVTDESIVPFIGTAEYLVVAGGGSAGSQNAGGGGAGGLLTNYGGSAITLTQGATYTITVGAGGGSVSGSNNGNDGQNSVLSGTGISTVTAIGGGGGGGRPNNGRSGGSGGGGSHSPTSPTGGSGTVGQGNDGGDGSALAPAYAGGGGGGAGASGGNATSSAGGNGGNGLANSITGSSVTYAGGGGGSAYDSEANAGSGGTGGGGDGSQNLPATSGTANTGGGGGASTNDATNSGAGGSGVVILRVPTSDYDQNGGVTGSPTVSTDGTDTILTFNASGSYTA